MVKPKLSMESEVRIHAIRVRSAASTVLSAPRSAGSSGNRWCWWCTRAESDIGRLPFRVGIGPAKWPGNRGRPRSSRGQLLVTVPIPPAAFSPAA